MAYKAKIEKQTNKKIKIIQLDRRKEFYEIMSLFAIFLEEEEEEDIIK